MSIKDGMLCVVLFILILFLAIKNYDALTHPLTLIPDQGSTKKSETRPENSPAMAVVREPVSVASYLSIAEKNIFNPERKDFPIMESGSTAKPDVRPQVILYGVTISKEYQSASVVNPGRPLKKGERDMMTLKLGERIGEYKLTKVLPDRIVLEAGGDTFEVLLYDPKSPKRRESGPPRATASASTPMGTPRASVRKEVPEVSRKPAQERTSPSPIPWSGPIPDQVPWLGPTPTQIPPPMLPTPVTPSVAPRLGAPPPGMGQTFPLTSPIPGQPPSPSGK
jgi:hypothetical protein